MMPIGEAVICYGTVNIAFVIVEIPHIYRIIFLHKEEIDPIVIVIIEVCLITFHEPLAIGVIGVLRGARLSSVEVYQVVFTIILF